MIQLPPGCATGVGSLPHLDVEEALADIARWCPRLPFWPQLPRLYGDMVVEVRAAGVTPPGLEAMGRALAEGRFEQAAAVKGQVCGPVTLGRALGAGREAEALQRVKRSLEVQMRALEVGARPVLLVLDEPSLGAAPDPAAALRQVAEAMHAARELGAWVGLHCCNRVDSRWPGILRPDAFFFDAALALDEVLHAPRWAGVAGLGLVPTLGPLPSTEGLLAPLEQAVPPADRPALARRAVVSAACGLAGLELEDARARLEAGAALAQTLIDWAG